MNTRKMAELGILLAVAAVLEAISTFLLPGMPQGGSVTLAMIPIFFIAFKYGVKDGLLAGFIFGLINFMYSGFGSGTFSWIDNLFLAWLSIIFDYFLAFIVLGFAGVFKNSASSDRNFLYGILFGGFLRYMVHSLSGVIFWSEFAGPEGAFVYSFIVYNLPYMSISIILSVVVGMAIKDRVMVQN